MAEDAHAGDERGGVGAEPQGGVGDEHGGVGDGRGGPPWETARPLVEAARRGDAFAMDDLLTLITPYVTRLCRGVCPAPADAADAVQEALTAIFRGLGGVRDARAFYGWVRAVTVREAVRVARRAAREHPVDPAGLPEPPSGARADGDLAPEVRDVLARLPVRDRAVLVLRELEGLDERTVAELLRVAPGTVKSRLHRARSAFRKAWVRR